MGTQEGEIKSKKKKEAELALVTEVYSGTVKLTIAPPIDFSGIKNLQDSLNQVKNILLILIGGSVDEGSFIVINLEKPVQMLDVRTLPTIEQTSINNKKNSNIIITLKPPVSG